MHHKINMSSAEINSAVMHGLDNMDRGIGSRDSAFRGEDRKKYMLMDQCVGQVATAAYCKYLYGSIDQYMVTRFHRNQNPDAPDGGYDLGCLNVDVKGSYMRTTGVVSCYNLYTPHTPKPGWIYVLVLIDGDKNPLMWTSKPPTIYLPGYAQSSDFPNEKEKKGLFQDNYIVPVPSLKPLPPLEYKYYARCD